MTPAAYPPPLIILYMREILKKVSMTVKAGSIGMTRYTHLPRTQAKTPIFTMKGSFLMENIVETASGMGQKKHTGEDFLMGPITATAPAGI